jgi:spermidine/putrescine transport system permease protein
VTARSSRAGAARHSPRKRGEKDYGLRIYAGFYLLFLYGPVLLLPLFSFNDSIFIAFPLRGFTTRWYSAMASDADMHVALANSLKVAAAAALASTIIGLMAARALVRGIPGRTFFYGFSNLPLFIPDIVLGISLLVLLTRIALPLSLGAVVLGHFVLCLPFSIGVLLSRLEGFDVSLEEASRDLGEDAWGTFRRVIFPLMLPGIVASLLLAFVVSFDDFLIAFFLCGTDTTLPVYIWGELRFPYKLPNVLALGATILVISTAVIAVAEWLRRGDLAAHTLPA